MTARPRFGGKRVLLALAGVTVAVLAIEAGFRLFDAMRGGTSTARAVWYWGFTQDRYLGYRARRNIDIRLPSTGHRLDTNADGFRDVDVPWSAPRASRRLIVCVGESSTWGTGSSSRATTWPAYLARALQRSDPRFRVLNAGMPGYTTVENVQLINLRLLKYEPEAIVYMGFRNDLRVYATSLNGERDLNDYGRPLARLPSSLINEVLMRSSLVGFLATRWPWFGSSGSGPRQPETITALGERLFRDQIRLMKTLADAHGIRFYWVDQPIDARRALSQVPYDAMRSILHDELQEQGIQLLQAHQLYDFTAYPMIDDVHFDDRGYEHLAGILATQLLRALP